MKSGRSLRELAEEITRRATAKKDYLVPTNVAQMTETARLTFGEEIVDVTDLAHSQIAEHTGIPAAYYRKMKAEKPELLANNVNAWFAKYPATRMVRTLDGEARAFLSDKYRPLENEDLAEAVLPVLMDLDVIIMSCEITDRRLYIKAVDRRIEKDIPTGRRLGDGSHVIFDTLSPAITISNSEVGEGSLAVMTSIFTRQCTNLATFGERSVRKSHVGAKHELAVGNFDLLSDETRKLTDKALWSQVKDVVKASFDEARFNTLAERMREAADDRFEGDPVKVVELAAKRFGVTEGEKGSILKHLVEKGDLSRWGLSSAVTRAAADLPDYDRASEFERLGGAIVELDRKDWKELAGARELAKAA